MGADLKRKEARKRKFGGQESESLFDTVPPKKKSKQAPPLPSSSERISTAGKSAAGKVAVVEESTDGGKEENLATQKAQRFIVFIGPSTLCQYGSVSRLTVLYSPQAIYPTLQPMSQYASTLRRSILNRSGIGKKRIQESLKASHSWNLKGTIE